MKKKTVVLDTDSEDRIKAEQKKHGATHSEIVRRAIKTTLPDPSKSKSGKTEK